MATQKTLLREMNHCKSTLKRTIDILLDHKKEADNSTKSVLKFYRIKEGELTLKNLQNILLLDIQSRGGPKLKKKQCVQVIKQFNKTIDIRRIKKGEAEDRFNYVYNQLRSIKQIGPKIAAVFMKNMVYNLGICPELVNYLYLPVDVHIRKILTKKLKVFSEREVPGTSEATTTKKSRRFQEILSDVHQPRIEFDLLWLIGHFFCSRQVACHLCWLKTLCREPNFRERNLNI